MQLSTKSMNQTLSKQANEILKKYNYTTSRVKNLLEEQARWGWSDEQV